MEERVQAVIPELETYFASGMEAFDVPGLCYPARYPPGRSVCARSC
jgi:hypothetical protein